MGICSSTTQKNPKNKRLSYSINDQNISKYLEKSEKDKKTKPNNNRKISHDFTNSNNFLKNNQPKRKIDSIDINTNTYDQDFMDQSNNKHSFNAINNHQKKKMRTVSMDYTNEIELDNPYQNKDEKVSNYNENSKFSIEKAKRGKKKKTTKKSKNGISLDFNNKNINYNNGNIENSQRKNFVKRQTKERFSLKISHYSLSNLNYCLPIQNYQIVQRIDNVKKLKFNISQYLVKHKASKIERLMEKVEKIKKNKQIDLSKEVEKINVLDHPNVGKIFDFYETNDSFYFIQEYLREGTIETLMNKNCKEQVIALIIYQIISAIDYCSSKHVSHSFLRPESVLIENRDKNGFIQVKVIDFGKQAIINKLNPQTMKGHFDTFSAPEALIFNGSNTPNAGVNSTFSTNKKTDIWSCGVIMYQLLVNKCPFSNTENDDELYQMIKAGKYDRASKEYLSVSKEGRELIKKMLEVNTEQRISAKAALEHQWFKKFNAKELIEAVELSHLRTLLNNLKSFNITSPFQKAALTFIVKNCEFSEEIRDAQKMFRIFDEDNDGKISKEDFRSGLVKYMKESEADYIVNTIFDLIDSDGSNSIELIEFVLAAVNKQNLLTFNNLKMAFSYFDKDNSGKITIEELKEVFNVKQLSKEILEQVDKNGDEEIDFEEFVQMMRDIILMKE